jgi:hypothetical protein
VTSRQEAHAIVYDNVATDFHTIVEMYLHSAHETPLADFQIASLPIQDTTRDECWQVNLGTFSLH